MVILGGPLLGYAAVAAGMLSAVRAMRGRTRVRGATRGLAGVLVGVPWAYYPFVRPWLLRWGATDEELRRHFPGDEAMHDPVMATTRAITIDATPDVVWPWVAQIGQGRGGFYSYDWLENVAGCDIHSADRIVPALQHPQVGEPVNLAPGMGLAVAAIEPGRSLLLRPPWASNGEVAGLEQRTRGTAFDASWAFVLEPLGEWATRLLVRFRVGGAPRLPLTLFCRLLLEPEHFVMERAMLRGIKRRAEASARRSRQGAGCNRACARCGASRCAPSVGVADRSPARDPAHPVGGGPARAHRHVPAARAVIAPPDDRRSQRCMKRRRGKPPSRLRWLAHRG
jgi:hypothetical protein